jgi:hypothetical protein
MNHVESIDRLDEAVLEQLGYAVARGQLFELALARLRNLQRQDLADPLRLPKVVADDVREVIARRELTLHHAWLLYERARTEARDDAIEEAACAERWIGWLVDQSDVLGRAANGLDWLTRLVRQGGERFEAAQLERVWRCHVAGPLDRAEPPGDVARREPQLQLPAT